jgi:FkbM family methyltransferase
MNIRNTLFKITPNAVWSFAGFIKRLPVYWKLDRSENLRVRRGIEGLPLFVTPDVHVCIPESVTAYQNWRAHGIEDPTSSVETTDFLELATGKRAFIDVGAQTGFMSALFAKSRSGAMKIISVEPDPQVHAILERARVLNAGTECDWTILHQAVSDTSGTISMPISNSLYESGKGKTEVGKQIEVRSTTLNELVESLGWAPDIIKIDVESFEYEILTTSLELISRLKPALQLEVHWEILRQRGLGPERFLKPLADIGYRGIRKRYRGLPDWMDAERKEKITRLSIY